MSAPYTLDLTERQIIREAIEAHESLAKNSEHMHQITGELRYAETAKRERTLAKALNGAIYTADQVAIMRKRYEEENT